MEIPIFKLNFDSEFRKKFKEGCDQILDSGILTNGGTVRKFEESFANLCQTRHALAVNSGTGALEVVLRALNVKDKKVVVPTNTFIATAVAVENAGGIVLPLDIEKMTFALCPGSLEKVLEENDDIGAVIIVHIGGTISQYIEKIKMLCDAKGVPLIEDAAHAHRAEHHGKKAGSLGVAGCFSFFPTKVMTSAEGGMITTNDKDLYDLMRSIRQFGQDLNKSYVHIRSGSNFKITEFQALLGLLDLERLPERLKRRTKLAQIYQEELKDTAWIAKRPPEQGVSSYYKQIVLSPVSSDEVHEFCASKGIALTGEVYRYPLHVQPVYQSRFKKFAFPVTDQFYRSHICPPLYPELKEEEIRFVCSALKEYKSY